ncbi:hypothetical protein KSP39_PZI018441 [Platanthera zijinensis]|uniref:RecA family profile 1 domain-containing protein n=1 Tax=Platanthera zijinensis TaxID=2320716 RepID=A0AAP0B471_9ASPA
MNSSGPTRALSTFQSQGPPWMNGVELLDDALRNKRFLPTGCEGLDTLLGGGLRQGHLTELVGPSASGKTQICLYVASYVAVKHFGSIVFFDTSNSFSPNRVASMINQICEPVHKEVFFETFLTVLFIFKIPTHAQRQERWIMKIMNSIHCQSVFDIFSLHDALHELESTLMKKTISEDKKICMLIVDSVSSLITPILGSKDSQGHSLMVSSGYLLKKLAHEWNLAILVINHMVSGERGTTKPAMGESWKCIPHVRLQLSRSPGSRICSISLLRHTSMVSRSEFIPFFDCFITLILGYFRYLIALQNTIQRFLF